MLRIAKSTTLSQHLVGDETDRSKGELGGTEEGAPRSPQTTGGARSVRPNHPSRIPRIQHPMQVSVSPGSGFS